MASTRCHETAGFLVAAPCSNKSKYECQNCSKPICEVHCRESAVREGWLCIACYRRTGAVYEEKTDDPYLFSGYYYDDYYRYFGSSHDDWRSDRGALMHDNLHTLDDSSWENDFDGS